MNIDYIIQIKTQSNILVLDESFESEYQAIPIQDTNN